jgi:AP endonuclease 1
MVRTSPRKRKQSTISFEKATAKPPAAAAAAKTDRTTTNSVKKETAASPAKPKTGSAKKGVSPKRKAPFKDEDEDEYGPEEAKSESEPPAKKQKTKGGAKVQGKGKGSAKGGDMAPLAARTAVGSLKRAMYIGAHISAAGGSFCSMFLQMFFLHG